MLQNEKIIETNICRHCGSNFDITDKDLEFYKKISPVFPNPKRPVSLKETGLNGEKSPDSFFESGFKNLGNGKVKYLIPPPTLCPDCRQQRRLSFRNERKLYKRKCDFSGKDIISIYSPDKPYKVYEQKIWWGDKWEATDYGKDFDFGRGFFEQFESILLNVPRINLYVDKTCENCNFTNQITHCKNSYLIISCAESENCLYGKRVNNSIGCIDCFLANQCKYCYEGIDIFSCFNCFYIIKSISCKDCYFIYDCDGCSNCILSTNLKNKSFYIENIKYTPEEYKRRKEEIFKQNSIFYIKEKFEQIIKIAIQKNLNIKNCENVLGDFVQNSKNSFFVFDGENIENIKYAQFIQDTDNSYDLDYSCCNSSLSYEISTGGVNMFHCLFSIDIWPEAKNCYYCDSCISSSYLFGCIGLRNKSYCILNKQYTKEEYEKLVPKIIEHMMTPPKSPSIEGESGAIVKQGEQEWGEFFPSSLSPFGYNETVAQEYYPINPPVLRDIPLIKGDSQNGVEAGGFYYIDREGNTYNTLEEAGKRPVFKYSTYEAPFPKVEKIIPASKLPENIADIPDDILNWAIECEVTKKPFRIIKEELAFYRKHNLPIPRRHPDQRHLDRMSLRNPRHLYTRNCDKCGKEIQTTYAPERPEIVYCEECYNKEIY
ncbi:hypothetical protein HGA92_05105 [Candidatus Gracilibacteria bacterium]|nr:hypothetical protein [Candidatus Gracilibacteria bacterium]NUJ99009.1 hypothetical protein [Candidatus Gracilibacteria bacterium]